MRCSIVSYKAARFLVSTKYAKLNGDVFSRSAQLTDGKIAILDLLLACKLAPSKSEARRLVQQGGVFADDEKVASIDVGFTAEQLREGVRLRKGKKVYHKAILG